MLPLEEAIARVLVGLEPLPVEEVPLADASGRILAQTLVAARTLPPEANSAMDGYALRASDTQGVPRTLRIIGEVPAGGHGEHPLEAGETYRIFTGAPLPPGADAVVMQEETEARGEEVEIRQEVSPGHNVRLAGDDVKAGDVLLEAGGVVGPAEVGAMASQGWVRVPVHRRPKVAILSTGNELVEVGGDVSGGRIVNSNNPALAAACRQAGAEPMDLGIAPDDPAEIRARFEQSLAADVIVSTGGVSVGDHDHVQDVMNTLGFEKDFWKIALKPGKPVLFGRLDHRPVFGLPGNPVSAIVTFDLLVRPVLRVLGGDRAPLPPMVRARLSRSARGTKGRANVLFVRLEAAVDGWSATPLEGQRSHRQSRTLGAHGLMVVPAGVQREAGEWVEVRIARLPGSVLP